MHSHDIGREEGGAAIGHVIHGRGRSNWKFFTKGPLVSPVMADSVGPRDAAVMEAILKEMGVEDYEPNVIHQMLEFTYSKFYVTTITVELAQKKALKTESFILCSVLIFEDIIMTLYSRLRPFVCS